MKVSSFAHKGLKKLYEDDSSRGVPAEAAGKLRKMFAYLDALEHEDELQLLSGWRAHKLTGNRKETWSLSVTGNLRLTFRIDMAKDEIHVVDLEDYH